MISGSGVESNSPIAQSVSPVRYWQWRGRNKTTQGKERVQIPMGWIVILLSIYFGAVVFKSAIVMIVGILIGAAMMTGRKNRF